MRLPLSYMLYSFAAVILVGFAFSFGQDAVPAGQKVFVDNKCQMCHSVESAGLTSKNKKAVDLSNVGSTYKADFLNKWLTKEAKIKDNMHKVAFKGDEKNLHELTAWLETLKTKPAPKVEENTK
jgi:cytochrome c2